MDKTLQVLLSNQYEWVPATCQEILSTVERGKDGRGGVARDELAFYP